MKTKFIKLFTTGSNDVIVYDFQSKKLTNEVTEVFTSGQDAVAKSSADTFVFFDGEAVGGGLVSVE